MAKVTPFPAAPDALPRVRGVFLVQPYQKGFQARAWPRKRGAPTNPYDAYKQAEFGYAAQWASSPEPVQLESATLLVKGSDFVPRDLLVRAIYGTAMEIQLEDGTILEPGRQVTANPQYILDLISDTPGAMLYRSDEGWVIIPPGNPGRVLMETDDGPSWEIPPMLSTAGALITTLQKTSNQTAAAGTEFTASFQSAAIDQLGIWDSSNPTRLYIPPDALAIRLSWIIRMTSQAEANTYRLSFRDPTGDAGWFGDPFETVLTSASGSTVRHWSSTGPWFPTPAFEYVTLTAFLSTARTTAMLSLTAASIEALMPA